MKIFELTGWEQKDVSVNFPLVSITTNEAFFDGLTFRKIDQDSLNVFVLIQGKEEEFRFKCTGNKSPVLPATTTKN